MIKDLVVNLTGGGHRTSRALMRSRSPKRSARMSAGVAFSYEPVIPPTIMGSIPASLIEAQRAENDKAATDAIAKFDDGRASAPACRSNRASLSASLAGSADRFGAIARRFDLSVVGTGRARQARARGADRRGRAVRLGPAGRGRALHPEGRAQARPRHGRAGTRAATRRARSPTRCRCSRAPRRSTW